MFASQEGYFDIVKFLVENGADINAVTTDSEESRTALMIAAQKGHLDIVKFLVEEGADVNAVSQEEKTVQYYAIKSVDTEVSDYINTLLKYNPFTSKSYNSTFTYFTQAEDITNINPQISAVKGLLKKEGSWTNNTGNYPQITEAPETHLEITIDMTFEENKLVINYDIEHQNEEINDQIPLYQQIFTEVMTNTHVYLIFPKEWKLSAGFQVIEAINNSDGFHHSIMACSPENSEFSTLLRNYNIVLEGKYELIETNKPQLKKAVDNKTDNPEKTASAISTLNEVTDSVLGEDEERRIEQLQEKYVDYQIYKIPFYVPEGISQAYSQIGRSNTIYFDKSSLTGNGKIFIEIPQMTFKLSASGETSKASLEGLVYELDIPEIGINYDPEYLFVEESTGLQKKRIDLSDDITMEFVYIPAGEFMMGSPSNEGRRIYDESPQHQVNISKGFWMGVYEVTNGQYQQFIKESNYDGAREINPKGYYLMHLKNNSPGSSFMSEAGSEYPVCWVSWNNACAFCEWLSAKEGRKYSLPTEAQWEYACRADRTTELDIKDDDLFSESYGNRAQIRKTHPVGQNQPNPFGLYDMYDNVCEWCQDWYGSYSDTTKIDPEGPRSGDKRVVRGDYSGAIISYRRTKRFCFFPDDPANTIGFRVVCEDLQ